MIWELIPRTTEGSAAVEFVEVPAEVAANDPAYSAKMCPQPVELMLEGITDLLPDPKRKRRHAMRPNRMAFVVVMMPRPREHRAAPRREGGASAKSGDDGGGGGSGDPPPHRKSLQRSLRVPRVIQRGRQR